MRPLALGGPRWAKGQEAPHLSQKPPTPAGPGPEPQGSNDKRLVQAPGKGPTTRERAPPQCLRHGQPM